VLTDFRELLVLLVFRGSKELQELLEQLVRMDSKELLALRVLMESREQQELRVQMESKELLDLRVLPARTVFPVALYYLWIQRTSHTPVLLSQAHS
jgi:hypothetical protein